MWRRRIGIALCLAALAAGGAAARCGVEERLAALELTLKRAAAGAPGALEAAQRHAEALAAESMMVEGQLTGTIDRGMADLGPALRRAEAQRRAGPSAAPEAAVEACDAADAAKAAEAGETGGPRSWIGGRRLIRAGTTAAEETASEETTEAPAPLLSVPASYAALALPAFGLIGWAALRRRRRRRQARYLCYLPATVRSARGAAAMTMVDFSLRGARLAAEGHALRRDERIEVDLGAVRRIAKVRWAREANAGLRFETSLSMRELETLLAAAAEGAGVEERWARK